MARVKNITMDCENPGRLAAFWQAATGYSVAFSNDLIANLAPPDAAAAHILLIKVPEPKSAKNRAHVDLEADDRQAEIDRLVSLGATQGETHSMGELIWTVMQDPEGNEFCVAQARD
jgi:hypothetical protein